MASKTTLRLLVAGEILLAIATIAASLLGQSSLPEALRTYEETRFQDPSLSEGLLVLLPVVWLIVARGIAWIGLFVFWRPARMWYLLTSLGGLAFVPFLGPYVETSWSYLLNDVMLLLNGFLLALIYYSPLKELYARKPIDRE